MLAVFKTIKTVVPLGCTALTTPSVLLPGAPSAPSYGGGGGGGKGRGPRTNMIPILSPKIERRPLRAAAVPAAWPRGVPPPPPPPPCAPAVATGVGPGTRSMLVVSAVQVLAALSLCAVRHGRGA